MGMKDGFRRFSQPVLRTKRWRALRMQILERDGFRCVCCGKRGRLEVDHIQPVRTHPELAFARGNLQSLCPACHTRKTRVECGHPEPDPRRKAWATLVRETHRNSPIEQ
ncbi:HNH endonuclease [Rhodovulum sulfidophilum]|uniref:HNH endonuclease n=1 Tax=Rhodovulum sulfidophilum TaxID=35806 RepID=UPI000952C395|nr:HNH endonuclease signature motif containing protein [Rhodovulum sulfidophilum]OLS50589.1 endonuclease [Rhodovulum sulfidophilum]